MPVFKVGFWKGLYHTPAMVKQLAENFRRFIYRPHASVNHHDVLACGRVRDVRYDGATLFLDVGGIPESVAKAWNAEQLHSPSIEYWDTITNPNHRLTSGFRLENGQPPGLILRAVTLCGNGPPAVKTLGPMPKAVYEDDPVPVTPARNQTGVWSFSEKWRAEHQDIDPCPASQRFSSEDFMDKNAMIASLQAADPSLTPELLATFNDQQLAMLLDAKQGAAASSTVADATPAAAPAAPGGAVPSSLDATKMMADCGNDPQKMMAASQKFMEETAKVYTATLGKFNSAQKLETNLQLLIKDTAKKAGNVINDRIKQFMDSTQNRIPPAQRQTVEKLLRKCDPTTVRKFSDTDQTGSELDEEMANIIKQFPVNPAFVRRFSDGTDTQDTNTNVNSTTRVNRAIQLCDAVPEMKHLAESMRKRYNIAV